MAKTSNSATGLCLNYRKLKDAEAKIDETVPILDVMKRMGLKVTRLGNTYRTLCFYHNDTKEPNLSYIANGKNFVFCFCCRLTRRPVRLWQDFFSKTFEEAVCDLAPMAGISLSDLEGAPSREELLHKEALAVNLEVANKMHDNVKLTPQIMEHLRTRFSLEAINQWQIGYCPDGDELVTYLRHKKKFSYDAIKLAGIKPKMFHDRIIFPLKNLYGNIVAFSARSWGVTPEDEKAKRTNPDGNDSPKYINTYASKIFNKSSEMYGLCVAREHVKANDNSLILVEGHPDVIAMHEAGFLNTAGVMSASFNIVAAKMLEAVGVQKIIFCFDGDRGGREGTLRILKQESKINQQLMEHGGCLRFYAVGIPWGCDPEEYLRNKDNVISMKKILRKPMTCLDFYIYNLLRTQTPQTLSEKLDFIYNIRKELHKDIKPAELQVTEKFLCDSFGLDSIQLCEYAKSMDYKEEVFKMEDEFIAAVLNDKFFQKVALEVVPPEWIQGRNNVVYRAILELYKNNDYIAFETMWDKIVYLGMAAHLGVKKEELAKRFKRVPSDPLPMIADLKRRGRKRRVADTMARICAKAKNLTEQELVEEIKKCALIFEAEFN
jgi:DNA primase catalytic core